MLTSFNLEERSYIALARPSDVKAPPNGPVRGAVYVPGVVCAAYRRHYHNRMSNLHYAYLVHSLDGWELMGKTCLQHCYDHKAAHRWKTVLDNRHPLAGMGVPDDWKTKVHDDYHGLVPLMGLIIQVEPRESTQKLLYDYLHRVVHGKGYLTRKQKRVLVEILRERGADEEDDWEEEIEAHREALKRRRDLAFRLARLAALDLKPEDAEKVGSLRRDNTAWSGSRMQQLTKKQVGLMKGLEADYHRQRVAAMERLARQLAVMLGEEGVV